MRGNIKHGTGDTEYTVFFVFFFLVPGCSSRDVSAVFRAWHVMLRCGRGMRVLRYGRSWRGVPGAAFLARGGGLFAYGFVARTVAERGGEGVPAT